MKAKRTSPRGRWYGRVAWAAGAAVLLIVGAVATADGWLPALAGRVGGLEFAERETRWGESVTWREVRRAEDGIVFTAESVRVDAPSRIARARGVTNATASGWELTVEAGEGKTAQQVTAAEFGWPELMDTLGAVGRQLERWVGVVALEDGIVRVAGQEIEVRTLTVRGADLSGTVVWRGEVAVFELGATSGHGRLRLPARDAEAVLTLEGNTRVKGDLFWMGNVARGAAEFADGGWMPSAFELSGAEWSVPAELLGLGKEYEALRGAFAVRRAPEGLAVTLAAEAAPRAEGFPAVRIEAAGGATAESVRLQTLLVEAPSLRASLSAPLEWRIGKGWAMEREATFAWTAELAALTGGEASGRAKGGARWSGGESWRVSWDAQAEGLAWDEFTDGVATLRGETTADETRLLVLETSAADGTRLEASGRYRHAERRVEEGVFKAEATGAALARWVPEGWRVDRASLAGTVAGEWAALTVAARAEAAAGDGRALAAGTWTRGRQQVALSEATLVRADGVRLELARAGVVAWAAGARAVDLRWAGGEAMAELIWAEGGDTAVRISNLDTSWVAAWRVGAAWPRVAVRELAITGRVGAAGWVAGEGELDAVWAETGWVRAGGTAGEAGVNLARLEIGQAGELLASGAGLAPWRVRAGAWDEPVAVEGGMWSLRLDSRAEATVWDELAKLAGVELERPALALVLSGPALAPSGRVELAAGRIGLRGEGLPDGGVELRELVAEAEVSRGAVVVERLTATVDGQRVEADGRLVLADGDWERLRARPFVWLRDHAEARVSLPEAKVAALARYLPTLLAPAGTVAAELRLSPGANLDGTLRLDDGATRPLGSFGVLQDIDVELVLSGQDVRIARMRALAGGQAVEITGGARRDPGRMPALDLRVRAERFPLVRKTGLMLRGDMDLAVKTNAGRTRVSGEVRLRDSLFLADIRPLIAAGGGGGRGGGGSEAARARPPYFSVDTPPLADWELAVRVGGEEFLRLRTPVFAGVASARFDLTGTLREPRAVGEAWVESGTILFPFASFAVQAGAVRLAASDPYTPQLEFRASGRRLGYDLRMELAGTADAPQLQLFSSPPLEAERLLLMITAGTSPAEGQGAASSSQRLAAVGAYVGRDLLRTFGVGGADEERLTLTSGERVSRQGRETYGFEFRLNDKWALAGEYDEFDAYNAGLRRRLRGEVPKAPAPEQEKTEVDDAR